MNTDYGLCDIGAECVCVCVCVCVCIYIYIYTHTHTQTNTRMCGCARVCVYDNYDKCQCQYDSVHCFYILHFPKNSLFLSQTETPKILKLQNYFFHTADNVNNNLLFWLQLLLIYSYFNLWQPCHIPGSIKRH
jgi:hypothetical protein